MRQKIAHALNIPLISMRPVNKHVGRKFPVEKEGVLVTVVIRYLRPKFKFPAKT